jgi:hypothetical protein
MPEAQNPIRVTQKKLQCAASATYTPLDGQIVVSTKPPTAIAEATSSNPPVEIATTVAKLTATANAESTEPTYDATVEASTAPSTATANAESTEPTYDTTVAATTAPTNAAATATSSGPPPTPPITGTSRISQHKIDVCLLGFAVAGDLAGTTIYTNKNGRKVWFDLAPPEKPASTAQLWCRRRWRAAAAAWSALSQDEKKQWHQLANQAYCVANGTNLGMWYSMMGDNAALETLERQSGVTVVRPTLAPR